MASRCLHLHWEQTSETHGKSVIGYYTMLKEAPSYGACSRDDMPNNTAFPLLRQLFPTGFIREVKELVNLAFPVTLCALCTFSLTTTAIIFCGHLDRNELAAVALASTVLNMTGIFVCTGLTSACDTLFSQAYGGQNLKGLGIDFQKSLILISLTCFVCWCVHLNVKPMLLVLHQDPDISRLAADYMLYFMPGLISNFVFQICVKFLQTQNIVNPTVIIGICGNLFNILAQYFLVVFLNQGSRGSAIALAITWGLMCLVTILYIRGCGVLKDTWSGWSWKALENWSYFMRLALAGVVMLLSEWWTFEAAVFLSGLLGVVQQGAISIALQIDWVLYMVPLGISTACTIRIGHNLGAGSAAGAKTTFRVAIVLNCIYVTLTALGQVLFRDTIPLAFTNDQSVAHLVALQLPLMGLVRVIDIIMGVTIGTLRGCGLQWIGGVMSFAGFLLIGNPLIVYTMLYTELGVVGFWYGDGAVVLLLCVVYTIIMARLDWDKQADKAVARNEEEKSKNQISADDGDDTLLSEEGTEGKDKSTASKLLGNVADVTSERPDQPTSDVNRTSLLIKLLLVVSLASAIFMVGLTVRLVYL